MQMGSCSSVALTGGDSWVSSRKINPEEVDLSHFRIIAIIGAGGFSRVFQAINRITKNVVAIKVMDKTRVAGSKTFYKSVWAERNIMGSLEYAFLLPLVCSFQSYYECYLVVPFMPGSDYTHYSRSHFFLNEEQVRFYFCQLVCALEFLHKHGIVHRDIKPRNVLLDADGNMRLCDFGLSHKFEGEDEYLKNTAGTDSYNAPEMVQKRPYRFSVDLWSLGVSLHEMLFRRRPFKSDKHMLEALERGRELRLPSDAGVSPAAQSLVRQLLCADETLRIGCGPRGLDEVREHAWLAGVPWERVERRDLRPPYRPREDGGATLMVDRSVFEKATRRAGDSLKVDSAVQLKFRGFEMNARGTGAEPGVAQPRRGEKRLLKLDVGRVFKHSMKPRANFADY